MKTLFKVFLTIAAFCAVSGVSAQKLSDTPREDVIQIMRKANDYWQSTFPKMTNASWSHAAYHTGNMAAYLTTKEERYRAFSESWAEFNQWKGAKSDDRSKWKYNHGSTDEYVLFGDWQTCFQTYIDLYHLDPAPHKIARAREVMEYQMSTPNNDYWWWADGLYMAMPVMTRLYKITENPLYLDKLREYLDFTDSVMYDKKEGLYYRDAKYVYPAHKSGNGGKDFWSRGDGWVFGGFARVLTDMPKDSKQRKYFEKRFKTMAKAIANSQQPEGYWTRSMLDPEFVPGPETSGTAFFIYGIIWGINNGLLNESQYLPVAQKGWDYLSKTALQSDGMVGYTQPIGEQAIPGERLNARSTANFGVGAFLLASSELVKYIDNKNKK